MGDAARPEVDADGDVVVVDAPSSQPTQLSPGAVEQKPAKRGRKRKRSSAEVAAAQALAFGFDRREALAEMWRREVDDMVRYFREELVPNAEDLAEGGATVTTQMLVARLMEGSALSLHKLRAEIYAKLQGRDGVTLESIMAAAQFVGGRVRYGMDNGRLDVAEDEDERCLWCWEARDVKLLPQSRRPLIKFFREARKKVHDRIAALSVSISSILKSKNQEDYSTELQKAVQRISQESNVDDIRSMVEKFMQKNSVTMMEKEAKLKEKQTVKEAEKAEKEKLKAELEQQKEKEKELKRQKEEAEKEEKRREKEERKQKEEAEKEERRREKEERKQREKEELESKRQIKRQQEEAERERKRHEKEEAELKSKLSLQKQANMMERFLKNKSTNVNSDTTELAVKPPTTQVTETVQTLVTSMDQLFSQDINATIKDIKTNQLNHWKNLCHVGRKNRWGVRVVPKMTVVKEIRLQGTHAVSNPVVHQGHDSSGQAMPTNSSSEKMASETEDVIVIDDDVSGYGVADAVQLPEELPCRVKKLLQFDKSHRPAYYGTWSKKSDVVGPRTPLKKDPTLDYEVDSDDEWEEEEPGESLTDCEDEADETEVEVYCEDDSEDGFFVPDGYLSENERGDADSPISSDVNGDAESLSCSSEVESEEFRLLRQHHKYFGSYIEKALRKSQPLIISNLMHEKSEPVPVGDLSGAMKIEQICLQALTMQACSGVSSIELSNGDLDADEDICEVPSQNSALASVPTINDSRLPGIVATIQACRGGINKVVEVLLQKFPGFSRTHMKNKVKEIADYNSVENQWKIKKEVTDRLGLSPERIKKTKGITAFFSKRCLPPEAKEVMETSPLQQKARSFAIDTITVCELNQQQYDTEGK